MKNQNSTPRFLFFAAILVMTVFCWPGQQGTISSGLGPAPAVAGVGVADGELNALFTASPDGRTIYMWQYVNSKPPKFIGQAEAILVEESN